MQLRPINGKFPFEKPTDEKYRQVNEICSLWELFDCIELEHNHRQGPDREYAELLNRIRFKSKEEEMSSEDLALLNSRILDPGEENVTKIFGKNLNVNEENRKKLAKIKEKSYFMHAVHTTQTRKVKINADGSIEKTVFLDVLELKVGARVMLINNVNTVDGLVNGVQGYVQQIIVHKETKKVRFVLVKFDNPKIGEERRFQFKNKHRDIKLGSAVPIESVSFKYTLGDANKKHGARGEFIQMPLKCSWALTSHKVSNIVYLH